MAIDLEKLAKILKLEAGDNYQNRKVYRGLAAFIGNWTNAALKSSPTAAEAILIEQVAARLTDYAELSPAARQWAIDDVLEEVDKLTAGTAFAPAPALLTKEVPRPSGAKTISVSDAPLKPAIPSPSKTVSPAPAISDPSPPLTSSATPTAVLTAAEVEVKTQDFGSVTTVTRKKATSPEKVSLTMPLGQVKGIGETYARLLEMVGLRTVNDALYFFPFRHEDFSSFKKISELMYGNTESVVANVLGVQGTRTRGGKELIEVSVADETGTLRCIFFNRRMTYGLKPGTRVVLSGKVEQWGGHICLKAPTFEAADKDLMHTGRLVPVYHAAGPIKVSTLRRLIKLCIDRYAPALPEHLPPELINRLKLQNLPAAVAD